MDMHKVVPQLLRWYIMELADPKVEWVIINRWFVQQHGLVCVLKKRAEAM